MSKSKSNKSASSCGDDAGKHNDALQSKSNTELLSDVEDLLDASTAEGLDVDYLMECLDQLDEQAPLEDDFDPTAFWDELVDTHPAIFEMDDPAHSASNESTRRKSKAVRVLRPFAVAAALTTLLCVTASAFGFKPIQALTEWGTELLNVYRNPCGIMELPEDTESQYRSLAAALIANGAGVEGCAQWIPKDYYLVNIRVYNSEDGIKYVASYHSERNELFIRVTQLPDGTISTYEKEAGGQPYLHNGVEFNIIQNEDVTTIDWQSGQCVYTVTGQLTEEEIELMVNSVQ